MTPELSDVQRDVTEFSYLFQRYESIYLDASKKLKIPQVSLYILHVLREIRLFEPEKIITQKDLTFYLSMSKQTVHSALKRLISKGLVKLTSIEGNLKSKNIIVTEKGLELIRNSVDKLNEGKIRAFERLSPEQRKVLLDSYRMFADIYIEEMEKALLEVDGTI